MKILIVQIGRIGDTILATPMFRAIAESIPGASIHVLVSRHGLPIVRNNPRLAKIFVYRKNPLSLFVLWIRLHLERYDWWIDPKDHFSREASFLVRIGGAKKSIGFNRTGKSRFTIGVPSGEELTALHGVERNLRTLAHLGIEPPENLTPELFIDPHAGDKVLTQLGSAGENRIILNISAGDVSRYWPVERWNDVVRYCLSRGYRVLIVHHPRDREIARTLRNISPDIVLFHSETIHEVIAAIPQSQLVVTPDTSIVHIASAFNVPQVALFPDVEWNYRKFRPLSQRSIILRPGKGGKIHDITSEEVINAIYALML